MWCGALASHSLACTPVKAVSWKSQLSLFRLGKEGSRATALELFPQAAQLLKCASAAVVCCDTACSKRGCCDLTQGGVAGARRTTAALRPCSSLLGAWVCGSRTMAGCRSPRRPCSSWTQRFAQSSGCCVPLPSASLQLPVLLQEPVRQNRSWQPLVDGRLSGAAGLQARVQGQLSCCGVLECLRCQNHLKI